MSDLLYDALGETRLRLERAIEEAQEELLDTWDRCARLEGVIRMLRHQQVDHALEQPASEETLVVVPDTLEAPPPPTSDVDDGEDPEDPKSLVFPTTYMPILEELWDIARRADSGT